MSDKISHAFKSKHYFVIGGGTLQYNFATEVKNAGFVTHIFDYNPNCTCAKIADYFHCISIDEKEKILEIAKKFAPVGIQTTATELGNITTCYVGEKLGLNTNSYEVALNTTDKSMMKKIFFMNGIPSASYFEAGDIGDVDFERINFPVVVKPADRSAGRGVTLAKNKKEFHKFFEYAIDESFNKKVLVEEVMDGQQFSVETISCAGRHQIVAFTEEYLDGSENFIETQQLVPARLNKLQQVALTKLVYKILNSFDIKFGCCHIEVKHTVEGFKVIEIASRMGGWRDVLVKNSLGCNYNKLLLDSSIGKFDELHFTKNNFALVKMIYTKLDFDFYNKMKNENPDYIIHDEVSGYVEAESKSLMDSQGFYYLSIPKTDDVDYYIQSTQQKIIEGGGAG